MKLKNIVAVAFGAALLATPLYAGAAQEGGTVCGRVNASPSTIFQLAQAPAHQNVIVARSQTEEVQASINLDGTYCFTDLHPDLHTLVALEDAFPTFKATVTPIVGQTVIVDLTGKTADI